MNKKSIAEIKRRFHLEHNNITCIRGCYVNNQGEIISSFTRSLVGMAQEEAEKYLAIFKRTLSGSQGQNLLDVDFDAEDILRSPEHQLLCALKDSALKDVSVIRPFLLICASVSPAFRTSARCLPFLSVPKCTTRTLPASLTFGPLS